MDERNHSVFLGEGLDAHQLRLLNATLLFGGFSYVEKLLDKFKP